MTMFPEFPVLFPPCSQSFPGESMRSRCSAFPAVTHIDVVPSLSNYIEQLRNIENIRNTIETKRLRPWAHTWNRRGTLGTDGRGRESAQTSGPASPFDQYIR
jgi:hypothetical protein